MSTDCQYVIPADVLEQHVRDTFSWQHLEEQIRCQEDLDAKLRIAALGAIPILASHLRRHFPAEAVLTDHPLAFLFVQHTEWARNYISWLGDAMEAASRLEGWVKLRNRIRQQGEAGGALFELNLASRALRQGLQVRLNPLTRGNRHADLKISITEDGPETLYVEATQAIDPLPDELDSEELFERVLPIMLLMRWDLRGGARVSRLPRSEEKPSLYQHLEEFWKDRIRDRTPKALVIEGLLEVWAADRDDVEAQESFVASGYPPPGYKGPEVSFDLLPRLLQRIRGKSHQLHPQHGGLIVIQLPWQWILIRASAGAEAICQELERFLTPYPHVNGMAIIRATADLGNSKHAVRRLSGGHLWIVSPLNLVSVEEVILVRNPSRAYLEADEVIDRLFTG